MSLDEEQTVGRITKHCAGLMKEVLTDVENFGVEFPINLDVKIKAVMIGACFLIVSFHRHKADKYRIS